MYIYICLNIYIYIYIYLFSKYACPFSREQIPQMSFHPTWTAAFSNRELEGRSPSKMQGGLGGAQPPQAAILL